MLHVGILGLPAGRPGGPGRSDYDGRTRSSAVSPVRGGGGGPAQVRSGRPPGFVARLRTRRAARGVAALTDRRHHAVIKAAFRRPVHINIASVGHLSASVRPLITLIRRSVGRQTGHFARRTFTGTGISRLGGAGRCCSTFSVRLGVFWGSTFHLT